MTKNADAPIALALSGGGIRAMAFHLGVLRFIAERNLLERVARISTVSGGSLAMGLIYAANDFKWPTSKQFQETVYDRVGAQLCARSMSWGSAGQLWNPGNWRFLLSRANLLARELRRNWGLDVPLSAIGPAPEWSINGTTAENGKRFRFKDSEIGDWELGYAHAPDFPLGDALAVSAAFPVGFGALAFDTTAFVWKKRPWNAPKEAEQEITLPYPKLHLYDGGVYDNLGAEPYFDPGTQKSKIAGDCIVICDAGAPLSAGFDLGPLNPFRLERIIYIMSDQTRALRIRSFSDYLKRNPQAGALILIGTSASGADDKDAEFAKNYPTGLCKLTRPDFERLAGHGYAAASYGWERASVDAGREAAE